MRLKTVIISLFILCLTVGIVSAHVHHEKSCNDCNKIKIDPNKYQEDNIKDNTPAPKLEEPDDSNVLDNTDGGYTATDDPYVDLVSNPNTKPDDSTISDNTDNGHISTDNPYVDLVNNPNTKPDDSTISDNTNNGHISTDNPYVDLVNNPDAKDPTFAEVVEFIKADETDKKPYVPGRYTCDLFARDVHNNAEEAGLRAAWVSLELSNPDDLQFCVAFQTTDRGLVYIDCTGEEGGSTSDCDMIVKDLGRCKVSS